MPICACGRAALELPCLICWDDAERRKRREERQARKQREAEAAEAREAAEAAPPPPAHEPVPVTLTPKTVLELAAVRARGIREADPAFGGGGVFWCVIASDPDPKVNMRREYIEARFSPADFLPADEVIEVCRLDGEGWYATQADGVPRLVGRRQVRCIVRRPDYSAAKEAAHV